MARIKWTPVLEAGARIVNSYSTDVSVRQLFYRLVAAGLLPNAVNPYKRLTRLTAEARRNGTFPEMADRTRSIQHPLRLDGPADAIRYVESWYRADRTEGQRAQVWVVLEKDTLLSQVDDWLDEYGIPMVALRGYTSTPLIASINQALDADGRKSICLYVGDLDPSGMNIQEVLERYTHFDTMERLTVRPEQIASLEVMEGKIDDPRAAAFMAKYPKLVTRNPKGERVPIQVEVEAIEPLVLEHLVVDAVEALTDREALEAMKEREAEHKARLTEIANQEE